MSESTAKATRRAVRRAVGPSAVEVVTKLGATAILQSTHLREHDHQFDRVCERLDRLEADARSRAELTLVGRLSWLLRGV
jgi:hypothetical protein